MKRRHLFDNGFPVSKATKLAGSAVLLAVANQSLRLSKNRLAGAWLRFADTLERVRDSRLACMYTRLHFHATTRPDLAREARSAAEPGERAASQTAHQP